VLGEAWDTTSRGPLNTLGAAVADGDVITAINRVKLTPATPPHALLANKADKEVFLAIGSSGSGVAAASPSSLSQRNGKKNGTKQPLLKKDKGSIAAATGASKKKQQLKKKDAPAMSIDISSREVRVKAASFDTVTAARYRDWVHINQVCACPSRFLLNLWGRSHMLIILLAACTCGDQRAHRVPTRERHGGRGICGLPSLLSGRVAARRSHH
jgi:hypothetical protein